MGTKLMRRMDGGGEAWRTWWGLLLCAVAGGANLFAADQEKTQFLTGFQMPDGFRATLYADESQVVNPVALTFDRQGRLFAAEIQRRETGVWGVTFSRWWAMEDYAGKTLEDRSAMFDRWAHVVPPAVLTRHSDRVRRLADLDGDGRADESIVFAEDFNDRLDGNAAGILALDGDVYLTEIPHLWRLRDGDGDGRAEVREKLLGGFGVRVGVHAHDMHGLTLGPEGRIYFSMGDRGFHVKTKEGKILAAPTRGAAFRCFPDGTGLEVFHHGLRNPQELAFNQWGDLFTVDNDMGGGDRCRVLHLMEQGDAAWHATYQLTRNFREETDRKDHPQPPWFSERLWELPHEGQPLWQSLPIAHLTRGPSGLAYAPGTGLPPEFDDTFFICDFVGSATRSGIHSFKLNQQGAGYRMASTNQFVWNVLPSDVAFGPDGHIYLTDWINGWGGDGERRIIRMWHEKAASEPGAESARKWLAADLSKHDAKRLSVLLGHADQRVRLRAQYEIASRGADGLRVFLAAANEGATRLARVHGIWGLWQMGLCEALPTATLKALQNLLGDPDAEVRAQTAKVMGEFEQRAAADRLEALLEDSHNRVRYFAALALRRAGSGKHVAALVDMLERNAETDRALRHAGVVALSELAKPDELAGLKGHPAMAVRLAATLALRRSEAPAIAAFFQDADRRIVFEAIRAVHDLEISRAWPALADLIDQPVFKDSKTPFPIAHRILNAHFRTGGKDNAARLAQVAANVSYSHEVRLEALDALAHWENPSPFDRVTWAHRPLKGKRATGLKALIRREILAVLNEKGKGKEHQARIKAAADLIALHDLASGQSVRDIVSRSDLPVSARLALFPKTGQTGDLAAGFLRQLLQDAQPPIRLEAAAALAERNDPLGLDELEKLLAHKDASVKAAAIAKLGDLSHPFATKWLSGAVADLAASEAIGAMALDVHAAASRKQDEDLLQAVAGFEKQLTAREDGLGIYALAMSGGDAASGESIFRNHAVQCVRCHRIKKFGGEAGPDLSRISRELDRSGIVISLIEPSARIAPGFASIEFELKNGEVIAGFVQEENDRKVVVNTLDGRRTVVPKDQVDYRSKPLSAMPSMKGALKPSEVRDLAAYLSRLK